MIERKTVVYLIAPSPQAQPTRPPIQPPAKKDDPAGRVLLFMLVFLAGMFFGIGIVASNRQLPPPEGGSGPNLPTSFPTR